jgi:hypothetical protein
LVAGTLWSTTMAATMAFIIAEHKDLPAVATASFSLPQLNAPSCWRAAR